MVKDRQLRMPGCSQSHVTAPLSDPLRPCLQAFYRFRRSDCNTTDNGAAAGEEQPPLIFLAGLGAAMSSWGPQLPSLLSCNREVILMEQQGAGLSVDYSPEPITYYTMAGEAVWAQVWEGHAPRP